MTRFGVHGGGSELWIDVWPGTNPTDEAGYTWRRASADATLGRFRAHIPGQEVLIEDLTEFHRELERLYRDLTGTASLSTLEGWLTVDFHGDGSGRLAITGELVDRSTGSDGNRLTFTIPDYDQTFLPDLIADLRQTIEASR